MTGAALQDRQATALRVQTWMARPIVNAMPNASCSRPVCPSALISAGPDAPARTDRTGIRASGSASGDQQRERPVDGDQRRPAERHQQRQHVRRPAARVAEPHRERPLARQRVGADVPQVVDHQQGAGQQPGRHRGGQPEPAEAGPSARTPCPPPRPRRRTRTRTPRRARGTRTAAGRRCRTRRRRRTRRPRPPATTTVTAASDQPGRARHAKHPNAADSTCRGGASPAATSRTGPTRRWRPSRARRRCSRWRS